ncbi:MAG: type II toxin-antitoxin system VapC family toxin [Planctomycetes bacterium]|nr:type II toxin-antitoxin system VapC family toxin [Planctomycetota bacterium]
MALHRVVLDTDTLSAIMRQSPLVIPKARAYLAEHGRFTLSVITRYEVLRGLKVKGAVKQVAAFDRFCARVEILPVNDETAVRGADIYAELSRSGELIGDADILIAASALIHGLGVSTNNESHFGRVRGLHVENWLR